MLIRLAVAAWLLMAAVMADAWTQRVQAAFAELTVWRWRVLVDPVWARRDWCQTAAPAGPCALVIEWRQGAGWVPMCHLPGEAPMVARYWRLRSHCEVSLPAIKSFSLSLSQEIFR